MLDFWWTEWQLYRCFFEHVYFPLSISFHQCCVLIPSNYLLLLVEGQKGEPGNLPKINVFFGCLGALDGNVLPQKMSAGRDCRLPPIARARVGARASPYGIFGGRLGTGTDVSTGTSVNDCRYQATVLRADLQLRSQCQQNA